MTLKVDKCITDLHAILMYQKDKLEFGIEQAIDNYFNNNTMCDCIICQRTRQFRKFKELLPNESQEDFEQWYSGIYNDLEAAETELEMIHRAKSITDNSGDSWYNISTFD